MRKYLLAAVFVVGMAFIIPAANASIWDPTTTQLAAGMSEQQVTELLSKPTRIEGRSCTNGELCKVWWYPAGPRRTDALVLVFQFAPKFKGYFLSSTFRIFGDGAPLLDSPEDVL